MYNNFTLMFLFFFSLSCKPGGSTEMVAIVISSHRYLHCPLPFKLSSDRSWRWGRHICFSSPWLDDQSSKFMEASRSGNMIPLHQCIFSDQLTPVLAYRCLVSEHDYETPSFLLESIEPSGIHHSLTLGRYSIVGANPAMEMVAKENLVVVVDHREGLRTEEFVEDPLVVPRKIMENWTPMCLDELPQVFCGGWFGYFSCDTLKNSERRLTFSRTQEDEMKLPDIHLGLYDDVLVFDHVEKKIYVIHWVQLDRFPSIEAALNDGTCRLESLLSRVHDIVNPRLCAGLIDLHTQNLHANLEVSSARRMAYMKAVMEAKEHIKAGEISKVVLSQQFKRRTFANPFEVYRALRIVNPSPFMAYIQVRGCVLVSTSPQLLTCIGNDNKIKAVELIEELEGVSQGPYGGCFGCISFSGDMDLAHSSRTIVFPTEKDYNTLFSYECTNNKQREWIAFLHGGASVMVDSHPRDVEMVCESEAFALARAIDLAESSFGKN